MENVSTTRTGSEAKGRDLGKLSILFDTILILWKIMIPKGPRLP